MSANFLGVAITAWKGTMREELVAGLERAKKLKDVEELDEDFFNLVPDEMEDANLEEHRDTLIEAFKDVIEEYDSTMFTMYLEIGTHEVLCTGGTSFGDSPNEIFDAMLKVVECGLYWGDRLRPQNKALKQRIIEAANSIEDPARLGQFQEALDEIVIDFCSNLASSINNDGWEAQLDWLFHEYEDFVINESTDLVEALFGWNSDLVTEVIGEEE